MPVKFFADDMLGKLARWLRLAGFDTRYQRDIPDAELVRVAAAEDRIILTRDTQLGKRWQVEKLYLVSSEFVGKQIGEVFRQFNLAADTNPFSRCLECNGKLTTIRKEEFAHQIPPYVYRTRAEYHRCPDCGRIYWKGTHYDTLNRRLQLILEAAGK